MSKVTNLVIVGVGGQGTLLASRILGNFYENRGLEVKVSEVHGMSQRGGSVVTYVRAGESVASPLVGDGEADVIFAFEKLEALRSVSALKPGGTLFVNTQEISPMPVITGAAKYPEKIVEKLEKAGAHVVSADALRTAEEAGSVKAVNVVMLGLASRTLGGSEEEWDAALVAAVKPKLLDLNRRAFALGRTMAR